MSEIASESNHRSTRPDQSVESSDVMHEPCDRCGESIPSNFDRSPNYCDECAVWVDAHGGDEI